jgi:hypothetical protein
VKGATTAELKKRAGYKSSAAADQYQHANDDRDRILANALADLANEAVVTLLNDGADSLRTTRTNLA